MLTEGKITRGICYGSLIAGLCVLAATIITVVLAVLYMAACDGTGGCGIVFAFAPMITFYPLVPLGIVGGILRFTLFNSRGKLVPADCLGRLKIGQKLLMITPWVGILVTFAIGFVMAAIVLG